MIGICGQGRQALSSWRRLTRASCCAAPKSDWRTTRSWITLGSPRTTPTRTARSGHGSRDGGSSAASTCVSMISWRLAPTETNLLHPPWLPTTRGSRDRLSGYRDRPSSSAPQVLPHFVFGSVCRSPVPCDRVAARVAACWSCPQPVSFAARPSTVSQIMALRAGPASSNPSSNAITRHRTSAHRSEHKE